jgi:hypothetical protein
MCQEFLLARDEQYCTKERRFQFAPWLALNDLIAAVLCS